MGKAWDQNKISSIHCFGDSLTEGYGVRQGEGWIELLDKRMKSISFYNHGVCGALAVDILDSLFASSFHPEEGEGFFFMAGTNDILNSLQLSVLERDVSRGIRSLSYQVPLTVGIPPLTTKNSIETGWQASYVYERNLQDLREYAAFLRNLAEKEGIPSIDFCRGLPADDRWFTDGVHPNSKGYDKMAQMAMKVWKK